MAYSPIDSIWPSLCDSIRTALAGVNECLFKQNRKIQIQKTQLPGADLRYSSGKSRELERNEIMGDFIDSVKSVFNTLEDAPEVNIHNFDITDVERLNDAMISAYNELNQALKEIRAI